MKCWGNIVSRATKLHFLYCFPKEFRYLIKLQALFLPFIVLFCKSRSPIILFFPIPPSYIFPLFSSLCPCVSVCVLKERVTAYRNTACLYAGRLALSHHNNKTFSALCIAPGCQSHTGGKKPLSIPVPRAAEAPGLLLVQTATKYLENSLWASWGPKEMNRDAQAQG